MAFALLAKLYLNSKVYTGVDKNTKAVAMCDSIIANKSYKLDGQQFTRHGFLAYLYPKYDVPSNLSISYSTTPEFHDRFNLTSDERNDTWLKERSVRLYPTTLHAVDH